MLNKPHDFKLDDLIGVAQRAGEILLNYFRRSIRYSTKTGPADIVTEADLESQRFIFQQLMSLYPDIPISGEEAEKTEIMGIHFLVDPLDGTLNFLHGLPYFSVSIALVNGTEPVAGVVYAPALNEIFYALKGKGAYFGTQHLVLKRHRGKCLKDAIAATGWPYDRSLTQWTKKTISKFQEKVQEVRILGSAALEMCYVAAGFLDLYQEVGLAPWDLAAGYSIAKEAGAVVKSPRGGDFELRSGQVLACSSDIICLEFLASLD